MTYYCKICDENNSRADSKKWTKDEVVKRVLCHMSCQIFDRRVQTWKSAARKQKSYMRKSLSMGNMDPVEFLERLNEMNEYLGYFPVEGSKVKYAKPLKTDEMFRHFRWCQTF